MNISFVITTVIIFILGTLSYANYGQYTDTIILLNLESGISSCIVQCIYALGVFLILSLQLYPIYKIVMDFDWYKSLSGSKIMKESILRVSVSLLVGLGGFFVPDLGAVLNLQGALCGLFICFLFPIVFYFKTFELEEIPMNEKILSVVTVLYTVVGCSMSIYVSLIQIFG